MREMIRTPVIGLTVLAVTALAMVISASPAWAATFTVDTAGDPIPVAGAGACTAALNDCSLRGAIEKSNATGQADTIKFVADFAESQHTITLRAPLTTGDAAADEITINGPGQSLLAVKQSVQLRVFQIFSGSKATIKGITISGGRSPNNAGGILNNPGAVLTLNDTTVTDNQALGTQQDTGNGGGIYNASNATLTLNRSTVSANKTVTLGSGGGIYSEGGTITLNDSTVGANTATDGFGGGIYNFNSILTLNHSTVSANKGFSGGGISSGTDLTGITTTIRNSTISGNTADVRGGGIYNTRGLTTIQHSTITNNGATLSGNGSGVASSGDNATKTQVRSSIVSANTNSDVDFVLGAGINTFLSKGFNRIGDGNATAAFNKPGDQSLVMVPGLGPLASNGGPTQTHAVLKGSSAVDRGAAGGCPKTDQRGIRRPQNGDGKGTSRCDVGAYEKKTVR